MPDTKHLATFVAIILFAGCTQSDEQQTQESFEHLNGVTAVVRGATSLTLQEGLPHNYWEPELYKAELANRAAKQIDGWHFYADPVPTSPQILENLRIATSDPS